MDERKFWFYKKLKDCEFLIFSNAAHRLAAQLLDVPGYYSKIKSWSEYYHLLFCMESHHVEKLNNTGE